ncbi:hypothetical protein [Stenotrophomonas sp. ATCM1_4]|uniref:hypothetical protein n=1 Tax=Stenotrophomonas sp. ATCM1_4 TaxID=2259330 RepID=UPI001044B683|nr:hypothetical protein [Stenotrophomonas sp. ATCM1_4]
MAAYRNSVFIAAIFIATVLAAFHSPGQISVDSGIALYEGIIGKAAGWGPTFFAAVLSWLGGGLVGTSIFIALNSLATYGIFAYFLTSGAALERVAKWRIAFAIVLAVNPLFMLYVGIIWKDVMLATTAAVAITGMLFQARVRSARLSGFLFLIVACCVGALPLLRQQGILLAVPLALALAMIVGRRFARSTRGMLLAGTATLIVVAMSSVGLSTAASVRIASPNGAPVSVGFLTIRAYDIIGMVAYARDGDSSSWSGASSEAISEMRKGYSPERIDSVWHNEAVRGYINSLSTERSWSIWGEGIRHDPQAYVSHRFNAFGALMGAGPMVGCVPAYWGVSALPEHLQAIGVAEEMDSRDRLIGAAVGKLIPTGVFRNWWYAGILLFSFFFLARREGTGEIWLMRLSAFGGLMYLMSFLPTTIACDFRYLFPVAMIATLVAMYLLLYPGAPGDSFGARLFSAKSSEAKE